MARRHISKKQAGYIDADFLHPPTFPLQSDGGPYIAASSIGRPSELAQNATFQARRPGPAKVCGILVGVSENLSRSRRGESSSTESAVVERNARALSCLVLCVASVSTGGSRSIALPSFPEPEKVIKSDKQFNAVTQRSGGSSRP